MCQNFKNMHDIFSTKIMNMKFIFVHEHIYVYGEIVSKFIVTEYFFSPFLLELTVFYIECSQF